MSSLGKKNISDERMVKVKRYLEKRKRRKWTKKISYDCRKSTADKRLRIKGRFVKNCDQMSIMDRVTGAGNLTESQIDEIRKLDSEGEAEEK